MIKIKRADGIFFDLKLSNLSDSDPKKVIKWAEKEAALEAALPLPAYAFDIAVSRTKFDTAKAERKVKIPKATTRGVEYETWTEVTATENWGYGVTISNRLNKPVRGLRIQYRIFLKDDAKPENKLSGTLEVGSLAINGRIAMKTDGIKMTYQYYQGRTSPKSAGRQIYGIWLRVYRGEILEKEYAAPENLITTADW